MAANQVLHPSSAVLQAFALGKLNDSTAAVVMNHLDSCPDCCERVAVLSGDDFLDRLSQANGRSSTPAPAETQPQSAVGPKPSASPQSIRDLPPELANSQQYEIVRELGRGGMGVVYLAKNKLMDRLEVLKVVNKSLIDHPAAIERFLREIRSAAKLSHANVVTAYSAVQQGEMLAFAMEYVEGQDLASLVKSQGPLPVPHACYYVQQAAVGLQHAFEKNMVHRDIKPQNLILAREGKKHIVKVLDFGLAKVMREKSEDAGLTGLGRMLGTPDYIAPEQSLDAAKADIRADIYSLGCTLYFLLSGRPPFRVSSVSAVLLAHQTQEAQPLNLVRPEVPEELAAVVRKMMAKLPAKRYQTPLQIVQALASFVKQKTTPRSAPELSSGAAKAAMATPANSASAPTPVTPEEQPQPDPEPPTPLVADTLKEGIIASDTSQTSGAVRMSQPATKMMGTRKKWLIGSSIGTVLLLLALLGMWASVAFNGKMTAMVGVLIVEVNVPNPEVAVDGKTVPVDWTDDGKKAEIRVELGTHKIKIKKVGFTVYGEEIEIEEGKRRVLTASLAPQVILPQALKADPPLPAQSKRANSAAPPTAPNKGDETPPLVREARVYDADLTGGFRIVDFGSASPRVLLTVNDVKLKQYFTRAYNFGTGQPLSQPLKHDGLVIHASFSPDGKKVITASQDNSAQVWDASTGVPLTPPLKHKGWVIHASFSPNGGGVITSSADNTARVWDTATGQPLTELLKHDQKEPDAQVLHGSFSPDGKRVVTAGSDKAARVWDIATSQLAISPLQHEKTVGHATFSPDGKRIVTASADGAARIWDAATGKAISPSLKHEGGVSHAIFGPDGKRVVTVTQVGTARVWDAETGQPLSSPLMSAQSGQHAATFSPDGKWLVTASSNNTAQVWDAANGAPLTPPLKHEHPVFHASFSPDGKRIVTASTDNTVRLWDASSGKELKHVVIAPAAAPIAGVDGWVSLFNGKDLTGWQTHPQQLGGWKVEDGYLVGRSADRNHLFSTRGDYQDFHLKVEARINKFGNSGIYFRSAFGLNSWTFPEGYQAQILHRYPKANVPLTGSLHGFTNVQMRQQVPAKLNPDDWFALEILAQSNRIIIKINGEVSADFVDRQETYRKGHLALQVMSDGVVAETTIVQFRKIEIKELLPEVQKFVPLFNGRNRGGWREFNFKNNWKVEAGAKVDPIV